jgi:hypothetical protein
MTIDNDVDLTLFGLFVHRMYTQKLQHHGQGQRNLNLVELAEMWALGD